MLLTSPVLSNAVEVNRSSIVLKRIGNVHDLVASPSVLFIFV